MVKRATHQVLHYTVEYLSCVATSDEYSSPFVFNFFRSASVERSLGASISWNTRNIFSVRTVDSFRLRTDMARSIVFWEGSKCVFFAAQPPFSNGFLLDLDFEFRVRVAA